MKLNFTRALILFFAAYIIVSALATGISLGYGAIATPPPAAPGDSPVLAPVFVRTVPFHVLVMLIVWPIFAGLYFRKVKISNITEQKVQTFSLALLWLVLAMTVDCVGFVLIQTPFSLTPHAFYVDYQPWISLIYLAIFLSPWIWQMFAKRKAATQTI
ncbi:MAG: hypothetical protein ACHQHN_07780 [Sphingobacteriales bacterium]